MHCSRHGLAAGAPRVGTDDGSAGSLINTFPGPAPPLSGLRHVRSTRGQRLHTTAENFATSDDIDIRKSLIAIMKKAQIKEEDFNNRRILLFVQDLSFRAETKCT